MLEHARKQQVFHHVQLTTQHVRTEIYNEINEENKRLGVLVENVLQTAIIDRGELKFKFEEYE